MSSKFHIGGVMRVLLLGLMVCSGATWVSAEEPKKEGAGDVQERRVPNRKLSGDQLTAMPGYTLQVGPNNTVSAMRIGGGFGFSGECACLGIGSCFEKQTKDTVSCLPDAGAGGCADGCGWVNQKPDFSGAVGVIAR